MTSLVKRLLPATMQFYDADDYEETTFLLYAWLLELLPTREFGYHIRRYKERSGSTLAWDERNRTAFSEARTTLFTNFDAVRLKLATLKAVILNISTTAEAEALFVQERLPRDCADLYNYLLHDKFFWPVLVERMQAFSDPLLMQDLVLDPHRLIKECQDDFKAQKVDRSISFNVWKKLRFVAQSNNESLDSIEQEIRLAAVSYYYKVRPFRNRLHATNYAKSSITGRVQQTIAYWTQEKHARLREETGNWNNPGNSLIVSTGNPEILAQYEGGGQLTWAQMVMG